MLFNSTHYTDKDSWEEMVKETVPVNQIDLQMELVNGCSDYRDYEEAWKWVKYYQLDYDTLPGILKVYIENQSGNKFNNDNQNEECWDDLVSDGSSASVYEKMTEELVHKFSLDESKSILVDNQKKFEQMINNLKVNTYVHSFITFKINAILQKT